MHITKVFYQCWDEVLPEEISRQNCQNMPEGFEYRQFSLDEARAYLTERWDPEIVLLFDSYEKIPHKIDLWRYCILYDTGGVYMDADCVLQNSMTYLVNDCHTFFVCNDRGAKDIFNGFLGTVPHNPLYHEMIEFMRVIKNDFNDHYYFNCDELFRVISRHIKIEIGTYRYQSNGLNISVLWDHYHPGDSRFYAYYYVSEDSEALPIIVETNALYPY